MPEFDLRGAGLAHFPNKYSILASRTDALGLSQGIERGVGLSTILAYARQKTDEAFRLLEGAAPEAPAALVDPTPKVNLEDVGLVLRDLSDGERRPGNLGSGVMVERAIGPAANGGVIDGDVVLAVGNVDVGTVKDLQARLGWMNKEKPIALLVGRGQLSLYKLIRVEQEPAR